ncbi:efflux RND transporter permease subunit [Fuchsiella alkaliacetigena]|uniref:efflux RND transporter permease subunit n=1 Tax=Fuchsiella alkaliacetigena TaxID=957042 RepID=UPI00200B292F|nr:MMPL family transporter [Fuchsiella alkaliacetigena]MCK8825388.1 MMPL family transporter [Fuchsiella alkaliacetigena]
MWLVQRFIKKYPKLIILVTILITVFFAYQALDVEIDTDMKEMFPDGHPTVETFDEISDEYGGSEYVVMILESENVINKDTLGNIDYLTEEFAEIEGVNKVRSISNIEEIHGEDFTIEIRDFIRDLPTTEEEVAALSEDLKTRDRYLGALVAEDFSAATIIAQLSPEADQQQVVSQVEEIREGMDLAEEHYLTGNPVLTNEMADNMKEDILRLFPLVSLIVMLILYKSFKSLRGVILPIAVVLISVTWTIGLVALLGRSLSIVSTVLPVLLVSVGSAYSIHLLARYYEDQQEGLSEEVAINNSIVKVGLAIIMAGVTTIAGFSSLGFSELTIIKEFGLFTAFGVLAALLISTFFVPAVLVLLKEPRNIESAGDSKLLTKLFDTLAQVANQHYRWVVLGVVVVCIISLLAIPRIQPETNYITFFEEDSEISQADRLANREFGGADTLELVIDTQATDGIEDPLFLEEVKGLQEDLEDMALFSNSMSVVELLEETNKALNEGDEEFERLPDSQAAVAQFLMLLASDDEDLLGDFIDFDHQESRIRVNTASADSTELEAALAEVDGLIEDRFGDEDYQITVTGIPVLTNTLTDMIINSQIRSLISSLILAFIITSILLKSPLKGFACSFPIAVTILFNFGLMGWTAVSLDVATSMIASIAVGIGVDYGIHFYTRYLEEREEGAELGPALEVAIHTVGRANYFNATAVTAGFLVLLLSSFPPLRTFGLLTSVTMIVSFIGAMVVLPALIITGEALSNALSKEEEVTK